MWGLARMSELQYGKIPELEKQLEAATQLEGKTMRLLRNKVTDAEIAEVLARWTGIPVSRMMESEREKLLRMEQELHHRVIGQNEAVDAVSNAIRRSRAGLADQIARLVHSCSSAQRVWGKLSFVRRWRTLCLIATRRWSVSICPSLWRNTRCLVWLVRLRDMLVMKKVAT